MNLLSWTRKPTFVAWNDFQKELSFREHLDFQQEVRRQNIENSLVK